MRNIKNNHKGIRLAINTVNYVLLPPIKFALIILGVVPALWLLLIDKMDLVANTLDYLLKLKI